MIRIFNYSSNKVNLVSGYYLWTGGCTGTPSVFTGANLCSLIY